MNDHLNLDGPRLATANATGTEPRRFTQEEYRRDPQAATTEARTKGRAIILNAAGEPYLVLSTFKGEPKNLEDLLSEEYKRALPTMEQLLHEFFASQEKKWEYWSASILPRHYNADLRCTVQGTWEDKETVDNMNQLGEVGWELMAVQGDVAIFKRPKRSSG